MPLSWMRCEECGGFFPIRRKRGKLRRRNHPKHMWCPWCERVTRHAERF